MNARARPAFASARPSVDPRSRYLPFPWVQPYRACASARSLSRTHITTRAFTFPGSSYLRAHPFAHTSSVTPPATSVSTLSASPPPMPLVPFPLSCRTCPQLCVQGAHAIIRPRLPHVSPARTRMLRTSPSTDSAPALANDLERHRPVRLLRSTRFEELDVCLYPVKISFRVPLPPRHRTRNTYPSHATSSTSHTLDNPDNRRVVHAPSASPGKGKLRPNVYVSTRVYVSGWG